MRERLRFPVTRRVALTTALVLNTCVGDILAQKAQRMSPQEPQEEFIPGGYL